MKRVLTCLCSALFVAASYGAPVQEEAPQKDSVNVAAVAEEPGEAEPDSVKVSVSTGPFLDFGKTSEVDFGRIAERGGKQEKEIVFRNSGNKPLVVTKTMVSCKCMSVTYPKKPILPGGEDKIIVTYNPRKQSGVFYKAVQVYSNDPQTRRIIFVKGEVVE